MSGCSEGVYKQGYPFEDYIGKSRKLADSERLPAGTETFDYFTKIRSDKCKNIRPRELKTKPS